MAQTCFFHLLGQDYKEFRRNLKVISEEKSPPRSAYMQFIVK